MMKDKEKKLQYEMDERKTQKQERAREIDKESKREQERGRILEEIFFTFRKVCIR